MPTPDRTVLPGGPEIARVVCGLWQVADIEKAGAVVDPGPRGGRARGLRPRRLRHLRHGRPLWQRRADRRPSARPPPRRPAPRRDDQMVPRARPDDTGGRARRRAGPARPARRRPRRPPAVPLVELRASRLARRASRDGPPARRRPDRRHRRHQLRRRPPRPRPRRRHPPRDQPGLLLPRRPPRRRPARRALRPHRRPPSRLRHPLRRVPRRPMARAPPSPPPSPTGAGRSTSASSTPPAAGSRSRASSPPPPRSAASTASRSPTSRPAGCWSSRRWRRSSSAPASPRASTAPTTSAPSASRSTRRTVERLAAACAATAPIPGDCGDEYRKPPFLTASGDLSHHLDALPHVYAAEPVPGRPGRLRVSSGSVWEGLAGYSRAVRDGDRILVSGTTATHGPDRVVAPGDAGAQTTYALDKIAAALRALGGGPGGRCPHADLPPRHRGLGGGVSRARPMLRRDPAGEYPGRRSRARRRLRGRDRGRGSPGTTVGRAPRGLMIVGDIERKAELNS